VRSWLWAAPSLGLRSPRNFMKPGRRSISRSAGPDGRPGAIAAKTQIGGPISSGFTIGPLIDCRRRKRGLQDSEPCGGIAAMQRQQFEERLLHHLQ
jgi:hypothetical protein